MNGIRFCLVITILVAVSVVYGQPMSEFDSPQRSSVTFTSPVAGEKSEKSNISFTTSTDAVSPVQTPAMPASQPSSRTSRSVLAATPAAAATPAPAATVPAPAAATRPVAQNTVSKTHRLRLAPQVFEKNLVEKLGSRFVPVRNIGEAAGTSRYRLPARDGTTIEMVIDQQRGTLLVTGSPSMVDSCLQIVQILDAEETGGTVTKFLPVQQANVVPAQRFVNIVNQETQRVAQVDRPSVNGAAANGATNGAPRIEGGEEIGSILGSVRINSIEGWDVWQIQGSPRDVATVQAMLRQLEALSVETEPIIELVALRHTDSTRMSLLVQSLYAIVYGPRRGPVTMLPLVKPNTILIIGRQESINGAKELIAKLDTRVSPNAAFRIFPVKHATATELATSIQTAFQQRLPGPNVQPGFPPQITITPDIRTNAVIVQGSPRDIDEVAAMIKQMDIPGGGKNVAIVKMFPLKNTLASTAAQVITSAMQGGYTGPMGQRPAQLSSGQTDAEGNLVGTSILYNFSVVPDTQRNALIVTALPDAMSLIATLIAQLDQLPSAESKIRVFTLVNGNAYELTTLLTSMFATGTGTGAGAAANQIATMRPGVEEGDSTLVSIRFQTDTRTNSIVAIGSEADLAVAEAVLLRLDRENMHNRKTFIMKLVNNPADVIEPILTGYLNTERQIDIQNTTQFYPQSPLEQYRKEANIVAEPITNSLLITTTPYYFEDLKKIIKTLDERPWMVEIQVLIAEVEMKNSRDRGVEFGLQDSILFSAAGNRGTLGSLTGAVPFVQTSTGTVGSQGITSLGAPATTGIGGFSFSASNESVSIFVRALETQARTQVLARPRLVTLHNKRASLQVGEAVPYAANSTVNNSGTTVSSDFRDLGTILDVTPRIMPDGLIAIALYVERSSLIAFVEMGTNAVAPHTKNTNASTVINAWDGQTVVFAGLITEQKRSTNNSIPGVNKIPIIKHLFEYDSRNCERSELLIVLTPRIIRTRDDMEMMNLEERERMRWCISDVVRLMGPSYSGMRLRSDEWFPSEVPHTLGTPIMLNESQLPPEKTVPLPMPMFPTIETK